MNFGSKMDDQPEASAILCRNISRSFGAVRALQDLSFQVRRGELFGLVGPDGAGKTTVMRILAAILKPASGDAWIGGNHTVKDAASAQERIGYMSQRFGLYPDLTVSENLSFYADIYGVSYKERPARQEKLLEFSGLKPFLKRRAGNLSGGMKQKLGLCCALIHTPEILLLDEPTNGVDPLSRRDFWKILCELLQEGVTILISTAYLDEAERCTRLALLDRGRLLACGRPEEIKTLLGSRLLEIVAAPAREAASTLKEAARDAGFRSVTLFGDRIHLAADDLDQAEAKARALLARRGVNFVSSRQLDPSLEDVFVSAMRRESLP
jgi:ABC-2 type transport system ATP-binding protein